MIGRPIVVLAFAASLVLPLACAKRESEEIETTGVVTVSVATAHRGTIRAVVTATAVVKPASGAELDVVPPAGARIAEMPVGVGDRVAKGGLLVKFEVPSLAAELGARESEAKSAEAGAAIARKALERQSYLVQRGIAAQKEVQAAERDLVDAEAALVASKESLDAARSLAARCIARAPFDGVVASRTHNPGDLVEPGADPILRFVDPSRLEVEASVPVADLARLKPKAPARVIGPRPLAPESATVIAVPVAVDPQTGIAPLRLAFAAPTSLPSGTPVRVEIVSGERLQALIVPSAAIVRDAESEFVYVVGTDDVAHRRPVTVGIVADPDAEIVSGLEESERVIASGAAALPDGAKIAIRE